MAIVTEHFDVNGTDFIRTYSDANRYVVRDGIAYTEANDPSEYGRAYTEGELISGSDLEAIALGVIDILMGEDE